MPGSVLASAQPRPDDHLGESTMLTAGTSYFILGPQKGKKATQELKRREGCPKWEETQVKS